jgi:IS30 family transposase
MSKQITEEQRYPIQVMLEQGYTKALIADALSLHRSSIGREVKRNCDTRSKKYNSDLAERKRVQLQKIRVRHKKYTVALKTRTEALLREDYSPEQVHGLLTNLGEETMSVENLYQMIWADKKAGGDLCTHLRRQGRRYHKRGFTKKYRGIVGRVDIKQRPAVVESRSRFGDLEVDLIIGKDHKGAILTVNDRASGVLRMCKVPSKEASVVSEAMCSILEEWTPYLCTITSDNGREFAGHISVTDNLGVPFFLQHRITVGKEDRMKI